MSGNTGKNGTGIDVTVDFSFAIDPRRARRLAALLFGSEPTVTVAVST